jgi:hypothetical protein
VACGEGIWNLIAHDQDPLRGPLIVSASGERCKALRITAKPLLVSPVFVIVWRNSTSAAQHVGLNRIQRTENLLRWSRKHAARFLTWQAALDRIYDLLLPFALRMRRHVAEHNHGKQQDTLCDRWNFVFHRGNSDQHSKFIRMISQRSIENVCTRAPENTLIYMAFTEYALTSLPFWASMKADSLL